MGADGNPYRLVPEVCVVVVVGGTRNLPVCAGVARPRRLLRRLGVDAGDDMVPGYLHDKHRLASRPLRSAAQTPPPGSERSPPCSPAITREGLPPADT